MTKLTDIGRRTFYIAALLSTFVIIGAPGGGGRGGFGGGGHGFGGGGYHGGGHIGGSHSRPRTEQEKKEDRKVMVLVFSLIGVCLIPTVAWMGYQDIKNARARRNATVRVTVTALLEGNANGHAEFFNKILKTASFAAPQHRVVALNNILAYLQTASVRDGFVQIDPRANSQEAGNIAQSLAQKQIQCVDRTRSADPMGEPSCVVGLTLTTTPERATQIPAGTGRNSVVQTYGGLTNMTYGSMDALYLFYSPAPGDTLSRTQANQMLNDLRELGPTAARQAA